MSEKIYRPNRKNIKARYGEHIYAIRKTESIRGTSSTSDRGHTNGDVDNTKTKV
jgi:hypothetical protein